ncbi:calponin-3 isoform X2 [Oncorhynchus mykiss]|uniref:calponin-3 isoform X2 n=1 Tax=Oncorhynchus mykiss TaxID=8022 RepID=UPI001877A219|nr:calponin-3 isoform X2 [Oncorhynchus mykiss]
MTSFNKGPAYGLSAEVKSKIAGKYDMQKEEELRFWIEEVTGMAIGENFQKGLKDGIILGELINKLQPGSIKKINHSQLNWHKAKTKGIHTSCDIGVKYADKQKRNFDDKKIKAGQCVIGLQMGTNKCASQAGMTAYGTRRHLYDPKTQTDKPYDQTTISLQMGTNKGASQAGMSCPGTRRDIFDNKQVQQVDNSTISLQMGTNKAASQKGMSAYGLGRQVYDPKYCGSPTEPVIHADGSLGTNCSEISDSDYQAEEFLHEGEGEEYPVAYHEEDDYSDVAHYNEVEQGIDY